mmetsp:Transcript_47141/g.56724  ORF Transcript_47141/g.56724 Transcript_47141/m.56724 type:complete len:1605 (-) Transcript_47141:26-4840(-)
MVQICVLKTFVRYVLLSSAFLRRFALPQLETLHTSPNLNHDIDKPFIRSNLLESTYINHLERREQQESFQSFFQDESDAEASANITYGDEQDFEDLNNLLDGLVMEFPNMELHQDVFFPFNEIDVNLTDIFCSNFSLVGIDTGHVTSANNKILDYSIELTGLAGKCSMDWSYDYDGPDWQIRNGVLGGSGNAGMTAGDNSLLLIISFKSLQGFENEPPTESLIRECAPEINIDTININGGVVASIAGIFENLLMNTMSNVIGDTLCDLVTSLTGGLDEFMINVSDNFTEWRNHEISNPLSAEESLSGSTGVTLFHYNDNDPDYPMAMFTYFTQELNKILGSADNDFSNAAGNENNLGINTLIRDIGMLDKEGILRVKPDYAFIPGFQDKNESGIIYEGEDILTKTKISWTEIRFIGLDSFTDVGTFIPIGKHTLLSNFVLEMIDLEVDLTIEMEPSTIQSSLIDEISTQHHVEKVTVKTGFRGIEFKIAVLAAIDITKLGDMSLGSLLHSTQVFPCLLSVAKSAEITQLHLSVEHIIEPILQGYISPGVDSLVNNAILTLFALYEKSAIDSIPGIFDGTIRESLNIMMKDYMSEQSNVACAEPKLRNSFGYIDMRDLLWERPLAKINGGSGTSPYGDIPPMLKKFVDKQIFADVTSTGEPKLNELIRPLTKAFSGFPGTIKFDDAFYNSTAQFDMGSFALDIKIALWNGIIENLDSLANPIEMFEPHSSGPYRTDYKMTLGAHSKPLKLGLGLEIGLQGNGMNMWNDMEFGVEIDGAPMLASLMTAIREDAFLTFPLQHILDPYCWLGIIPAPKLDSQGLRVDPKSPISAALTDFKIDVEKVKLSAKCLECSSPGMVKLAETWNTDAATEDATNSGNTMLDYLEDFVLEAGFVQVQIDRWLNEAKQMCPLYSTSWTADKREYEDLDSLPIVDETTEFILAVLVVLAVFVLSVVLIFRVIWLFVKRSHVLWLKSLSYDDVFNIKMDQKRKVHNDINLSNSTKSMSLSDEIPYFVRIFIPFTILGNVALFISGHLSIGASLLVYLEVAGESMTVDDFFTFSLAKSTYDMWVAGSQEMAIIMLILSGIWPYVKQFISLALWFTPPEKVSIQRRGSIFLLLDSLGKWSMFDIFITVLSIVSFRVTIESPTEFSFIPSNFYFVDLITVPLWGLYANMSAQIISQISSHFIIYYHRKVVDASLKRRQFSDRVKQSRSTDNNGIIAVHMDRPPSPLETNKGVVSKKSCALNKEASEKTVETALMTPTVVATAVDLKDVDQSMHDTSNKNTTSDNMSESRVCLCNYQFALEGRQEGQIVHARPAASFLAALAGGLGFILIILGSMMPSIGLETLGLVGLAVEAGQSGAAAKNYYSVFSIINALWNQALFLDTSNHYIGHAVIIIVFVVTGFIVPIFQIFTLLVMWFIPLKNSRRNQLHVFNEILEAWQYLQVFLLALIVACWQLGQMSEYLLNGYCKPLNDIFNTMAYYQLLSISDAQCLYLKATLEPGALALFIGSMMLNILNHFVMHATMQHKKITDTWKHVTNWDSFTQDSARNRTILNRREKDDLIKAVHIVRPQFTDIYRYLLEYENKFHDKDYKPVRLESTCDERN